MTNSISLALLHGGGYLDELENHHSRIYQVDSLKGLVRLLLEKPIDLIVVPNEFTSIEKLQKIFNSYHVPFVFVGGKAPRVKQSQLVYGWAEETRQIQPTITEMSELIRFQKIHRENKRIRFVINHLKIFTESVVHTSKDMFISEVKEFFKKYFKMESCHWVEVKPVSSKLPSILKLKNELENQQVSQVALLKDLDDCSTEICAEEDFQIWKTNKGEYMVMVWMTQSDNIKQCLILNRVSIRNHNEFQPLLHDLTPFLNRRWNLCLVVGEARNQVYQDSLTSLYNQRFLAEVLDKKIEENKRYKTPFSVLFIDVDHFKRVNDSLGHVIGSGVLQQLGELLKGQIRNSDYAFRYGGDEFIILLSHTEGEDAMNVAERIRSNVENERFELDGIKVRITVSIGLACFPQHAQSPDDIVRIADEAMYYGKHKSRNIVYKAS